MINLFQLTETLNKRITEYESAFPLHAESAKQLGRYSHQRSKDVLPAVERRKVTNYVINKEKTAQIEIDKPLIIKVLSDFENNKISRLICSQDMTIGDKEANYLESVGYLIKAHPEIIIDFARTIPQPNEAIESLLKKNEFWKPPTMVGAFGIKDGKKIDGTYRYSYNMAGQKVSAYFNKTLEEGDDFINARLFSTLGLQSRWGNLWVQIAAAMLWEDCITEASALRNLKNSGSRIKRKARDLATIQTISRIISKWSSLPFYQGSNSNLIINPDFSDTWTTGQITLMYSLLELSKEEMGCNLNYEEASLAIRDRIEASFTSFETVMLEKKGLYNHAMKMVVFKSNNSVKIRHSAFGGPPTVVPDNEVEFEVSDGEYETRRKKLEESMKPYMYAWFMNELSQIESGTKTQNSELTRKLLMTLLIFGNPGIYYKTALKLEAVASIEARVSAPLKLPTVKASCVVDSINSLFSYDWTTGDPIWKDICTRYFTRLESVGTVFTTPGWQEFYVQCLTANSQGSKAKVEPMNFMNRLDGEKQLEMVMSVAQARLMAFLLSQTTYSEPALMMDELSHDGSCTVRFQNGRRSRVVEMVSNIEQLAYTIPLRLFNEMKKHYDSIAVGKQLGGVMDMKTQLIATGNARSLSVYSDVSAMDASTQPFVGTMFPYMIAEYMSKHQLGPEKYFGFSTQKINITDHKTGITKEVVLPSLAKCILFILGMRHQKGYALNDSIIPGDISVNSSIFESGRFDTSKQHTVLLDIISEICEQQLFVKHEGVTVDKLFFGDDSYQRIHGMSKESVVEGAREYIRLQLELLKRIGYEIDVEASFRLGDFLQQLGYNGVVVPKSARTSVYTDERGSTAARDVKEQIEVVTNVFNSASQRCYAPENVQMMARCAWVALSCIRIQLPDLFPCHGRWKNRVRGSGKRKYFCYPYLFPSICHLNFPNQNIVLNCQYLIPCTSMLRTIGDAKYIWLINHVLSDEEKRLSSILYPKRMGSGYVNEGSCSYLDLTPAIIKRLDSVGILDSMVLAQYSRTSKLSKERNDIMKKEIFDSAGKLDHYRSKTKLFSSFSAWRDLKFEAGIIVPNSLSYWANSINRLTDLFASAAETTAESASLNLNFMRFMKQYSDSIPKEIVTKLTNLQLFFDFENRIIPIHETHNTFPLLPGYRETSDYDNYMQIFGSALSSKGAVTKLLANAAFKYGKGFDLDLAIKFGVRAKAANKLGLYLDVLALDEDVKSELQDVIENNDAMLFTNTYSSGFQPDALFGLSGQADGVIPYLNLNSEIPPSQIQSMNVVARDMYMLAIHISGHRSMSISGSMSGYLYLDRRRLAQLRKGDALAV